MDVYQLSRENSTETEWRQREINESSSCLDEGAEPFCSKAFVLPARLTHTRFMPVFHRWIFSHFMCGVPVTDRGIDTDLITIDDLPWSQQGWFRVEAQDHLERTPEDTTLREKLDKCLKSNAVDPKTFPYCYLVTPPRFLSFPLFNAVTLWFLYFKNQKLGALLVEVHNSSQERRNYLLHDGLRAAGLNGEDCPPTAIRTDLPSHIEFTCDKVFHANAFTSRDGLYSTRAVDPLNTNGPTGFVDTAITLKSETGPTRLVARLLSKSKPVDPSKENRWEKLLLVLQCTGTMIVMFPQAIFQMFMLRFKRKLKLFAAPVPLPGSVSRPSTEREVFIENLFRHFLKDRVESFPSAVRVQYESAEETTLNPVRKEIVSSRYRSLETDECDVELEVLSPAFYSSLTHYNSIRGAVQGEIVSSDYSAGTIRVQKLDLLKQILGDNGQQPPKITQNNALHVSFMQHVIKIRSSSEEAPRLSALESYVLSGCDPADVKKYIWTTARLLVDRRSGIGLTALKLWGLIISMVLGGLMSAVPALNDACLIINRIGHYFIVTTAVVCSVSVSKADLAEFLLI